MRKTQEKEIDGIRFQVHQLSARRAQNLFVRMVGMAAPALARALGGLESGSVKNLAATNINLAKVGEALPALFERFSVADLDSIQNELLEPCFVLANGKSQPLLPVWDLVMQSPFTGLKLTLFALEVNYGSFSDGLGGLVTQFIRGQSLESSSQNTLQQNGTSGASLSAV